MSIPAADPLSRFVGIYDALNAERGWWSDASSLRFASVAAITCPGTPAEVAGAIRRAADAIKEKAGWFGQLNSSLRFVVSAMLVSAGDSAEAFLKEVDRVRERFREAGLRRGGIYEAIAALILRRQARDAPVADETIERFRRIYEEMKRHHWWLTGPEDFPACALLAGAEGSPEAVASGVEEVFQSLNAEGFGAGDPLQTAASILHLARLDPREAARRYTELARGFREAEVAIWKSDYDEIALLSFLDQAPAVVVARVLAFRKSMEDLRPRPGASLTFNLAASVAFLDLARGDAEGKLLLGAKALQDMQAIINAQRAAAAGSAGAAG